MAQGRSRRPVKEPNSLAQARVAVVIVNYRTPELTKRCLAALRAEREALPGLKVVVVDGGSGDDSSVLLADEVAGPGYLDWVSFLPLPINGGFGWANNQAILTLARGEQPPEFIHFLNPDAEIMKGAVVALLRELLGHPRCGAAGSQLLTPDKKEVVSAFAFPSAGREIVNASISETFGRLLGVGPGSIDASNSVEVDWVTGASFMARSETLRETGLFDDGFFLYFDEVELMHRMKARGWAIRHVPDSRVIHAEGSSSGVDGASNRPHPAYWYRSRRRYFARTQGRAGLVGANLAWLLGSAVASLKKIVGRAPTNPARTVDIFRAGLWANRLDLRPSIPAWGDPPGKPPAWMDSQ
jgi:hypothetical protein